MVLERRRQIFRSMRANEIIGWKSLVRAVVPDRWSRFTFQMERCRWSLLNSSHDEKENQQNDQFEEHEKLETTTMIFVGSSTVDWFMRLRFLRMKFFQIKNFQLVEKRHFDRDEDIEEKGKIKHLRVLACSIEEIWVLVEFEHQIATESDKDPPSVCTFYNEGSQLVQYQMTWQHRTRATKNEKNPSNLRLASSMTCDSRDDFSSDESSWETTFFLRDDSNGRLYLLPD